MLWILLSLEIGRFYPQNGWILTISIRSTHFSESGVQQIQTKKAAIWLMVCSQSLEHSFAVVK
jgi:hypothetical protein